MLLTDPIPDERLLEDPRDVYLVQGDEFDDDDYDDEEDTLKLAEEWLETDKRMGITNNNLYR